jgi:hypothetical protein
VCRARLQSQCSHTRFCALGIQRQLRFLKQLLVNQSTTIFWSIVSEASSLMQASANYVELILLLYKIRWRDTRSILFFWSLDQLISDIASFLKLFYHVAGNWSDFLWDSWIQTFSCMLHHFCAFLCSMFLITSLSLQLYVLVIMVNGSAKLANHPAK